VAILQFLPSGVVLTLALDNPALLGRTSGASELFDQFDLSDLNAVKHGVSRQHCQLRRQDDHLIVTDRTPPTALTSMTAVDSRRKITSCCTAIS
jgi:hypothetical protein